MGTTWSLRAHADRGRADEVRAVVETVFSAIISQLSTWLPDSFISRFNRAAPGEIFVPPDHFSTVWARAVQIANASGGAFDPCHGAQVRARGFGPEGEGLAVFSERHCWNDDPISLDDGRIRQPGGIELDLSAIAKGHGVDQMGWALEQIGISSFLAEIGGEFTGSGVRADLAPWWVELERPVSAAPHVRIALCDCALATSGGLHKYTDRHTHIIRDQDDTPARNLHSCVSVLADDCMSADGWATALFAAGEAAIKISQDNDIVALFTDMQGNVTMSDAARSWLD